MFGYCKDCKHRGINKKDEDICEKIHEGLMVVTEDVQDGYYIVVHDDFGCVLFEGRQDESSNLRSEEQR